MSSAVEAQLAKPYESAGELREIHEHLLEVLDDQLGPDPSAEMEAETLLHLAPQIQEFVERGAATGAYIEEIAERSACQTLVDYWASSLVRAGEHIEHIRLTPFDSAQLPELPNEPCPYVGLETFREENQSIFFGRDDAIKKVVTDLRTVPLVIVSGASGSGKSSLVLGGVLPKLRSQHWAAGLRIIPPFVPGTAVLEHLAASVRQGAGASITGIAADVEALRSNPRHLQVMSGGENARPMLIIIDQFEEIFTLSNKADCAAMTTNLAQFLEIGRGCRLVLTVRAEFENEIKEHILPSFNCEQVWYSIPEMDYEDLREAILKPAESVNLHFKPEVVDHLVKRVIHQPAALPLLQFTLRSLWDVRDHNRITWDVYKRIGGDPLVVLASSAKAFLDKHKDPETLDEIKRLLLELVRVDERLEAYRQPVAQSRLLATGKANTKDVLKLLEMADFVRITPDLHGEDAVVEVKHESLIRNWPELVTWIGEKRDWYRQRLALTDAAVQWKRKGKPDDALLTGLMLTEAVRQPDLSELEQEYIRASNDAADKARRELQRKNETLASRYKKIVILFILCIIFLIGTIFQWNKANNLNKMLTQTMGNDGRRILRDSDIYFAKNDISHASKTAQEAEALAEELTNKNPENYDWQDLLYNSIFRSGDCAAIVKNFDVALQKYDDALKIALQLAKEHKDKAYVYVAFTKNKIADIFRFEKRWQDAEKQYRDSLAIGNQLIAREPKKPDWLKIVADARARLGDLYLHQNRLSDALEQDQFSLPIRETLAKNFSNNDSSNSDNEGVYLSNLSSIYNHIGDVYKSSNNLEKAEKYYKKALDIRIALTRKYPNEILWKRGLANQYATIANVHLKEKRFDAAVDEYSALLEIRRQLVTKLAREDLLDVLRQRYRELVNAYALLGDALRTRGEWRKAQGELPSAQDDTQHALTTYKKSSEIIEAFLRIDPKGGLDKDLAAIQEKIRNLGQSIRL